MAADVFLDKYDHSSTLLCRGLFEVCVELRVVLTIEDLHALALLPNRLALEFVEAHGVVDLQRYSLAGLLMCGKFHNSICA